jgi:glucose/arabinose dehydrogenase
VTRISTRIHPLVALVCVLGAVGNARADVPLGSLSVRLEPYATGFASTIGAVDQYTAIDMTPLGDGRELVLTLGGLVRVVDSSGVVAAGPYLNVNNPTPPSNAAELGPISIVAHPDFLNSGTPGFGKFYTITQEATGTAPADFPLGGSLNHQDVVKEWTVADPLNTSLTTFAGTSRDILRSDRPTQYHTVQDLTFDSQKYLVITSGDGGASSAQAQNNTNIFGTVLRIDPLSTPGDARPTGGLAGQYRINPSNFGATDGDAGTPAEIYAYGVRSPFRISTDRQTGDLWLGEVGQSSLEEIDKLSNGGNFGWPNREGTTGSQPPGGSIDPLFELYHNLSGQSEATNIIGGFVYRGSALPQLTGRYIFADLGENNGGQPTNVVDLFYGDPATSGASAHDDMFRFVIDPSGQPLPERIYSIAQDENGELYILGGPDRFNFNDGTDSVIYKLVAPSGPPNGIVGDVNQDGRVFGDGTGPADTDDLTAFKAGWYTTGHSTILDKYTHGDLNLDGTTNLADYYLMYNAYLAAGGSAADFDRALGVPEPSTWIMALAGAAALIACGKRRRGTARTLPAAGKSRQ